MRIHSLRLADFRHVSERGVEFDDGVTIVEGPNEVGKSALADALRLLLDPKIKHTSQSEKVKRECPADRDAWPTVEAEIECGEHRFVYRKSFARGSAGGTELELVAPRHAKLKGDEASNEVERILRDDVDLPLFHALQVTQGEGVRPLSIGGGGWLADALDEAAGGTGDSDGHEPFFEKAREAFEIWFTPTGRDRSDSERERLQKVAREAKEAAENAKIELDKARDLVESLERIEGEVRDLEKRLPGLEAELEAAEQELKELESKDDERAQREEALAGKRSHESDLQQACADRERRAAGIDERRKQLEERAEKLELLRLELEAAETELRSADRALESADAERKGAAELSLLRERDLEDAERAERIDDLERRRAELGQILDDLGPLEKLAAHKIDHRAAAAVTEADAEWKAAVRAAKQAAPSVELEAFRDVTIEVDGAPRDLDAGQSHEPELRDALEIRIPDLIAVRVRAGTSADEQRAALERTRAELDEALRAVGSKDATEAGQLWAVVSSARARLEPLKKRREQLTEDLAESERGPLAALEIELSQVRTELERSRAERPADPPPPTDRVDAKRLRDEASRSAADANDAERSCREARNEAREGRNTKAHEVDTATDSIEEERTALTREEEALAEDRERESDDSLRDRFRIAQSKLRASEARYKKLVAELEAADLEGKRSDAENLRNVVPAHRRKLTDRRAERDRLRGQVEQIGGQGLFETHDECVRAQQEVDASLERADRRAAAAQRLYETLDACRDEARSGYRRPLRESIEKLARPVFGDRISIELDDEMGIASRTIDGVALRFDQLSVGAREQLDLIHRIAVAQLVAPKGGVPLILDDTLGNADPGRLKAMNLLLARAGELVQVIVLTCHPERFDRIGGARTVRLGP